MVRLAVSSGWCDDPIWQVTLRSPALGFHEKLCTHLQFQPFNISTLHQSLYRANAHKVLRGGIVYRGSAAWKRKT